MTYERVDRHWRALTALSGTPDSITFASYENLEKIMDAWYTDGKLQATGYLSGYTGDSRVNGLCSNLELDENDRIVGA